MKSKNIKIIIVGIVIIVCLIIIGLVLKNKIDKSFDYNKYLDAYMEDCSDKTLKSVIEELKKNNKSVKLGNIIIDDTMYAQLNYKSEEDVSIILGLKNNKVSIVGGNKSESYVKKKLCNIKVDDKKETQTTSNNDLTPDDYDTSEFQELATSELMSKINKGDRLLVYIGRATCYYCVKFIPNLKQAQKDYNYKTIYIDLTKMAMEDRDNLKEYDSFINTKLGVTPMLLIFNNGKYVDGQTGYVEYNGLSSFLEKNGYKKS